MQSNRRKFLKLAALTGMGVTGVGLLNGFASEINRNNKSTNSSNGEMVDNNELNENDISIIGLYGAWANSLNETKLPAFSYRRNEWKNLQLWKKAAIQRLTDRLAIPDIGGLPKVKVHKQHAYDGLHIEELTCNCHMAGQQKLLC